MSRLERVQELSLPAPWLALALWCYDGGGAWIVLGLLGSFYFFLTGLRQSHGAQHYSLGIPRVVQDLVLCVLSLLMLASMHAVQVSHLHHHQHCLDDEDAEGAAARLRWWQALLVGPAFLVNLHRTAWGLGAPIKRRWIAAELGGIAVILGLSTSGFLWPAARWHVLAMLVGECLTAFFAVWTVHHDCQPGEFPARTQRGRWLNRLCYSMFFHAEHHLFPQVPTCHLATLAIRLDASLTPARWRPVVGRDRFLAADSPSPSPPR
jgi:fatty acid desaturase